MRVRLFARDNRPPTKDRQRAALQAQLREINVGVTFKLYDDVVAPEYRVHELVVKGRRCYARVEQLQGYGAGVFTVAMAVRDNHPDYPGELIAILPAT